MNISVSPLMDIMIYSGLTVCFYFLAKLLYLWSGKRALLHPMLGASIGLIASIILLNTPIDTYQNATSIMTIMIAPLSIGLMVPLAENTQIIRRFFPAIVITLIIGACFTMLCTLGIALLLGVSKASLLALATKSITTPVALAVGEEIGALPSLSSLIVIITGVIGVITAPIIFHIFKITNKKAQGLTLGLSAHIIGSAYAIEQTAVERATVKKTAQNKITQPLPQNNKTNIEPWSKETDNNSGPLNMDRLNNEYVAFSIVSMCIVALISGLVLPWLILKYL